MTTSPQRATPNHGPGSQNHNNTANPDHSPQQQRHQGQGSSLPGPNKHLYHTLYSSPTKKNIGTSQQFFTGKNDAALMGPREPLNENSNAKNMPHSNIDNNDQHIHINEAADMSIRSNKPTYNETVANTTTDVTTNTNSNTNVNAKQTTKVRKPKLCKVCEKPIIGTLVRAMGSIYHVDCFTCYDCKKPCSDKFFAADIEVDDTERLDSVGQPLQKTVNVPLCEYDYFKRIDLICYTCNNAIRGSYITALGRKYHSEHFFCEVCHKVFESDNYYANEGKIYCHFHYSKLHAFHCQSCKCAILKQYVEIYRGGKQQQWHPECFMVHKFWNVDITVNSLGLGVHSIDEISSDPDQLYKVEVNLEKLTISIWSTLSEFEESCAALISEMLHSTTTNNKALGLLTTSKLIFKIRCLFKSIESLRNYASTHRVYIDYTSQRYQNFSKLIKEPRSLTSKLMSFLTFLRDVDSDKLSVNKYSQELLSLISTIAHFIKLISKNALMHALEYNKLSNSIRPTDILLSDISKHENYTNEYLSNIAKHTQKLDDLCTFCHNSIEEECILFKIDESKDQRWHISCFRCNKCPSSPLIPVKDLTESAFNPKINEILCPSCAAGDVNAKNGFQLISRFMQLTYLLEIALIRSKAVINKRERNNHNPNHTKQSSDASFSSSINSYTQRTPVQGVPKTSTADSYENKVSEIARRRSLREARTLNNANREVRKSIILEAPIAWTAGTETDSRNDDGGFSFENSNVNPNRSGTMGSKKLKVREIQNDNITRTKGSLRSGREGYGNGRNNSKHETNRNASLRRGISAASDHHPPGSSNAKVTSKLLQNESSLTLDDIPRIVSSEQAREHRPNAFRFQKRDYSSKISNLPKPKSVRIKDSGDAPPINGANGMNLAKNADSLQHLPTPSTPQQQQQQRQDFSPASVTSASISSSIKSSITAPARRYSDLSNKSHEYIRHIAAYALYNMFSDKMTLDECIAMIDVHKSVSFWEKIFGGNSNAGHGGSSKTNTDFKSGSATISGSGKGVFGIALNVLVAKYGVDSDLGVGSSKVRIPLLIDELINVMRTQDVSAEGVFRLNGNIRRLRALIEAIDKHPERVPKLENETPIQLAALLKKFLRDLPIPLLTFKLYDLFLLSQRLGAGNNASENDSIARKRDRVLKLAYAMLPKVHRDLAEVLFAFLSWVATFASINDDEDENVGGSKMDTHNLATVITPNILYANINVSGASKDAVGLVNSVGGENQFLAIEVVNDMIEMNDELSVIPEDIMQLYKLAGFDEENDEKDKGREREKEKEKDKDNLMYTKDIFARLKIITESNPGVLSKV